MSQITLRRAILGALCAGTLATATESSGGLFNRSKEKETKKESKGLFGMFSNDKDTRTMEFGGKTREYLVYAPPPGVRKDPAPVMFFLHGGSASATQAKREFGFDDFAARDGVIVVYPNAYDKNWNDGRGTETMASQRENVDDVGFVLAILDEIQKEYKIDPKRVYAAGISNGGIFSQTLAIRHPDRFAAVGSVVGGIAKPVAREIKDGAPVSVLIIQGTKDPIMPFDGGVVGKDRGEVLPTRDAVQLWVKHNKCSEEPKEAEVPKSDPDDGCRVTRFDYSGGAGGSKVVYYRVDGGGHTWPGGKQYLPKSLVGAVARDIDASKLIWDFFFPDRKD